MVVPKILLRITMGQISLWSRICIFVNLVICVHNFSFNQRLRVKKISREVVSLVQVILFEIECAIFYTNLHELFSQFMRLTVWVNFGKFMDNCWISGQGMADMEKI